MPLPVVAASLGGMILSALTVFFATKIPVILAALGLSAVVYTGLDSLSGQIVSAVQGAASGVGAIGWGGTSINVMGLLGAAGLWDAVNIILSGYVSVGTIKMTQMMLRTVTK